MAGETAMRGKEAPGQEGTTWRSVGLQKEQVDLIHKPQTSTL